MGRTIASRFSVQLQGAPGMILGTKIGGRAKNWCRINNNVCSITVGQRGYWSMMTASMQSADGQWLEWVMGQASAKG